MTLPTFVPVQPSFLASSAPVAIASSTNPYGTVQQRADKITALQKGWTTHSDEKKIRDIILSTHGAELSTLKRLIDLGGESHDLVNLLNDDIDDAAIKKQIVAHFYNEAVATGQVKVYSDIDDTFYSNLKDARFPKGTIYPGVRTFYRALDLGKGGNDATGDMLFLTARPGIVEDSTLDMLKQKGVAQASVLEGNLLDNLRLTEADRNSAIAATKVTNFMTHRALYPEYGSVFIGDSGQGDAIAGAEMLRRAPGSTKAVYIHNVTGLDAAARAKLLSQGIVVFDSYLDAAIDAFGRGLISRASLTNVAKAARAELNALPNLGAAQRVAATATLAAAEARLALVP
ncbi:MAG: hypothetical protein IT381_08765 [Deltaproteobacteria bacterium]|nr:hypothetical protein [Deltaproteobacteria bacterium]